MKVLLVDDEALARQRLCRILSRIAAIREVRECSSGREAIALLTEESFDLVLLDIRMRDMDGFDVVAEVRPGNMPPVIFVTAFHEFALRAFDVHALDYLLKPASESRMREAVEWARRTAGPTRPELQEVLNKLARERDHAAADWLMIKSGGEAPVLRVSEIDLFESAGNYVYIHADGERWLHRESLVSLEQRLDPTMFVRIHRSTIVNLGSVQSVEPIAAGDYEVHMQDGRQVRMSRTYRSAFMDLVDRAGTAA